MCTVSILFANRKRPCVFKGVKRIVVRRRNVSPESEEFNNDEEIMSHRFPLGKGVFLHLFSDTYSIHMDMRSVTMISTSREHSDEKSRSEKA